MAGRSRTAAAASVKKMEAAVILCGKRLEVGRTHRTRTCSGCLTHSRTRRASASQAAEDLNGEALSQTAPMYHSKGFPFAASLIQ